MAATKKASKGVDSTNSLDGGASVDTSSSTLTTGTDSVVPRLKLGEVGQPGLQVLGGNVLDQYRYELQWPYCIHTFNEMRKDATVSAAIQLVETMISKTKWSFDIPHDATPDLRAKKVFLEQVFFEDMDTSFYQMMKEISSFNTYGFAVMEKVFRKRLKTAGSYYNDGLIGLKCIVPRGQETISKWEFDENNRNLTGVRQWTTKNTGINNFSSEVEIYPGILIPREKITIFRTNARKNNPVGQSPLIYCWEAWKFKKALEESEAVGVSKDLRGIPIVYMPIQYMVDGASDADKATFEYMKNTVRNIHRDEQEGMILPFIVDESGNKMFTFELAGVTGSKSYDVNGIIDRYSSEILMSFFADVLKLGQNRTGSYGLADSKTSIVATRVETALMEIQDQFNNDIIKQLASLNGWDPTQMPKLVYGDIDKTDLDIISSALQRVKATGLLVASPKNINYIASLFDLPDRVDEDMDQDELNELLGPAESSSGKSLESGLPGGTGVNTGNSGDATIANKEN